MIELEKTYISSSMEAQIAEMIGRDEKSNDYRFYHLFSSLVFDKTKKELRFPILREIWRSGVAVKRYLEYPCKSPTTMIHVWKSVSEYLSKGAYIVNFVDEKKVCEDIILIVAIDEKKRLVTIRYKKLTGDIVEQTLSFEEYADDFLSESIQKHLVRFDIFDIVKQTGQVDRKEIREHWENAKLSFCEQRKCMKKVMNMEKVLGEWFVVFQNAVSYLAEKGVMNQSPLVQSDYELFSCESKNLGKKLKRYCEILSNASDYIMGEEK